ncbi:NUDIX domain-containing protein [Streptomyces sp. NBC_00582]|uniref:NUDIX domain-containing protein n=1 Tax=Streptomyces sp. NBC_00582 TaxID=2975783 RepID=UPI002E80C9D0|nr:NUDIX domain-containing protein [Streptomyces sp. NBC_00582]WUB68399.1 NUDIX domain-containing protein [Streptomyces sp. NBC_00582]
MTSAERDTSRVENLSKTAAADSTQPPEPVNASAIIHDGQGRYLLHLRDANKPWIWEPGCWSLLGGGQEPQDLSLLDTVRRELREEAGLALADLEPYAVEHVTGTDATRVPIQVFSGRWNGDPTRLSLTEGVMLAWVRPEKFPYMTMLPSTRTLLERHAAEHPPPADELAVAAGPWSAEAPAGTVVPAGWSEDFLRHLSGDGCPMCANDYASDDIGWGALLRRGEVANAYLWRSGRVRGYCVLIHRGAPHVAEPTELSEAEAAAYWRDTLALGRALTAFYRPVKMNYSTLGNVVPHLHSHVCPRYAGHADPAPGGPLEWQFLDGGRQDEGRLQQDAAALRVLLGNA